MSAEQTEAIVLRLYAWSETSCVVNMFTREFGKQAVLAKGAWRPKSPFEGALDLLAICRVVFLPKAGDALGVLTEAKLVEHFRIGRSDLLRLYCGYYVAELLDQFTEKADREPELYDLAVATLKGLGDLAEEPRALVLRFEMQLLRLLGHAPTLDRCAQCGAELKSGAGLPTDPESSVEIELAGGVSLTRGDASQRSNVRLGTDAVGREAVAYAPLAGGVVCTGCRAGLRPLYQLPALARRELLRFSGPDWREISTSGLVEQGRAAIRGAVERTISALLDRRLNLSNFLQELGH